MITEVVTGNSRAEIDANVAALQQKHGLDRVPAPQQLETGTLILLRMAAHSRSPNQQEYFAPAVVLQQYEPNGEIDALVWDASAGNAFVHGYAIRDLGTRDTQQGREQYVIQSNIGQVLFSPAAMLDLEADVTRVMAAQLGLQREFRSALQNEFAALTARVESLEASLTAPGAAATAPPSEAKAPAVKPVTERK
jgi:hypothetical protein